MIFALILGFLLGAGALLFILQNTAIVQLVFLGWQFETSLALVVLLALLTGALVSLLLTLPGAIGGSFRIHKLRKDNDALVTEAQHHKQAADEAAAKLHALEASETTTVLDLRS